MMLSAIAIGISTSVRVSNWRVIESKRLRLPVLDRGVDDERHASATSAT
jgi:hypothetical protein